VTGAACAGDFVAMEDVMIFRREMRRDVVETAAVGGMVHETRKAHAEEAELAEVQAQQAQAAAAAATPTPAEAPAAPEAAPAAPPAAAGGPTEEQVSELERVAKLKEEGILTDQEFAAEKARILGL
jgi:hypothetical protein